MSTLIQLLIALGLIIAGLQTHNPKPPVTTQGDGECCTDPPPPPCPGSPGC